jgi:hypothetical protein
MGDYGGSSGMDAMGGYGDNLADGGSVGARIKGPGTGTSDSIQASSGTPGMPAPRVSAGEVIVPTDTVNQFGELLFQNLIRASHRPVRR